jgi:hypothetical protein
MMDASDPLFRHQPDYGLPAVAAFRSGIQSFNLDDAAILSGDLFPPGTMGTRAASNDANPKDRGKMPHTVSQPALRHVFCRPLNHLRRPPLASCVRVSEILTFACSSSRSTVADCLADLLFLGHRATSRCPSHSDAAQSTVNKGRSPSGFVARLLHSFKRPGTPTAGLPPEPGVQMFRSQILDRRNDSRHHAKGQYNQ